MEYESLSIYFIEKFIIINDLKPLLGGNQVITKIGNEVRGRPIQPLLPTSIQHMSTAITIRKINSMDAALLSVVALNAYCDHYLHLWFDNGEWY